MVGVNQQILLANDLLLLWRSGKYQIQITLRVCFLLFFPIQTVSVYFCITPVHPHRWLVPPPISMDFQRFRGHWTRLNIIKRYQLSLWLEGGDFRTRTKFCSPHLSQNAGRTRFFGGESVTAKKNVKYDHHRHVFFCAWNFSGRIQSLNNSKWRKIKCLAPPAWQNQVGISWCVVSTPA